MRSQAAVSADADTAMADVMSAYRNPWCRRGVTINGPRI